MKTSYLAIAAVAILSAGCNKESMSENTAASNSESSDIAVSAPVQTKTAFGDETDGMMNVVWSEGDRIRVIDSSSEPAKEGIYVLKNGMGGGCYSCLFPCRR